MKKIFKTAILMLVLALPFQAEAAPTETVYSDFFFLGDFHTYDYASHVDLDRQWIGTVGYLENQFSWQHSLPGDLNPNGIERARLFIDAAYVGSNGNSVQINGFMDWDPLNHTWFDNSYFDLSNVADTDLLSFWGGGQIDVTVASGEGSLRLDNSLLMLDYSPVSGTAGAPLSAVPEPASLALLGLGLVGFGIVRRKRQ